jgi:hypothetical protein
VLDTVMFAVSASAFLVFTTAFVGVPSFAATGFAFFVFTFEFQESALFGVTNTSLFGTAFIESFGFWFVTGGAKSVWIVFWEDFVAFDSNAFASVVFATGSGEFGFVNELLTFWTDVVFIETAALSEGSDIFTSCNTVFVTATWHANIIVLVPFVSDWIFVIFMDAFVFAVTFLFGTSTSRSASFNGTFAWADWVFNDDWTMFSTFTSVNFATFFRIDVFTIVEFFFFFTNWNWSPFIWEHGSTFVWVLFIGTGTNWFTTKFDAARSPVINMIVFIVITNWRFFASGSFVDANSLFVIFHVQVIAGIVVESVVFINSSLSPALVVTVTSSTHIVSVLESVV